MSSTVEVSVTNRHRSDLRLYRHRMNPPLYRQNDRHHIEHRRNPLQFYHQPCQKRLQLPLEHTRRHLERRHSAPRHDTPGGLSLSMSQYVNG